MHEYDIILIATIEIGGKYRANTAAEAIEAAQLELRAVGDITNIQVERQILVDEGLDDLYEG